MYYLAMTLAWNQYPEPLWCPMGQKKINLVHEVVCTKSDAHDTLSFIATISGKSPNDTCKVSSASADWPGKNACGHSHSDAKRSEGFRSVPVDGRHVNGEDEDARGEHFHHERLAVVDQVSRAGVVNAVRDTEEIIAQTLRWDGGGGGGLRRWRETVIDVVN